MTGASVKDIREAVEGAVLRVASNPSSGVQMRDVAPVAEAVTAKVAPALLHATNNEPWYRSRVTWGAIGAIVLPLLGAIGIGADVIGADEFIAIGVALGTVASGALTLYGRWKARAPIGQ